MISGRARPSTRPRLEAHGASHDRAEGLTLASVAQAARPRAAEDASPAPSLDAARMIRRELDILRPQIQPQLEQRPPLSAQREAKFNMGARGDFELFRALTAPQAAAVDPFIVDFVTPPAPQLTGRLFGDRGPMAVSAPENHRVVVEPGARAVAEQALRSTPGERPQRKAETNEEARHRLAGGQIDDHLSPEEVEAISEEVLDQLRRAMEFDATRIGEDEWD
ncbi:hypothetical protein KJ940_05305 [Myxococcota bacterium]|nr:hypothetical protein [Myxococcota bacterium]